MLAPTRPNAEGSERQSIGLRNVCVDPLVRELNEAFPFVCPIDRVAGGWPLESLVSAGCGSE